MPTIRVATLNLRKGELRWGERAPLLMNQLAALRPDIIGFQEIDLRIDQGNWIRGRLRDLIWAENGAAPYRIHHMFTDSHAHGWGMLNNTRENASLEALGIMTNLPVVSHTGFDYLIRNRVAHCVRVDVDGHPLDFWNTHFHHVQDGEGHQMRAEQAEKLSAWIATHSAGVPAVLVGDFNAIPESPTVRRITEALTSVFDRLGVDPPKTVPTPLPEKPWYPGEWTVDHIFVSPDVRVIDASRVFDQPDANDPTLVPSDHYGLTATVEFPPAR
jgi:beta-glucosidase